MAFDPNNPPSLIASGIGGSRGLKAWAWKHSDPIATVIGSGYIRTARKLGMGVGDAVRYVDLNNDPHHLVLAAIDPDTGWGTVAFPETSPEAYPIEESPTGEIYVVAYVDGVQVRIAVEDLPEPTLTYASQAEAEAGVAEDKPMNALRTAQAIVAQGDARFASAAQGDLADSATQPGDLAAVATSGDYDDLINKPVALTDGDKGDVVVSSVGTAWAIARRFDTVADLLADTGMDYTAGVQVVTSGQIVEAQGFRYAVADSAATDAHVETAGGVKLYVQADAGGTYSFAAFGAVYGTMDDQTDVFNHAILCVYKAKAFQFTQDEVYYSTILCEPSVDYRIFGTVFLVGGIIVDLNGARCVGENGDAGTELYDPMGQHMFQTGRWDSGTETIVSNAAAASEVTWRTTGAGIRNGAILNANCALDLINFQEFSFTDGLRFTNCSAPMRIKGSFYSRHGVNIPHMCRQSALASGQPAVILHGAAAHEMKFDVRIAGASVGLEVRADNSFKVDWGGSFEEGYADGSIGIKNNGAYCQGWKVHAYFEGVRKGIVTIDGGGFNACDFTPQYFSACEYAIQAGVSGFRSCTIDCVSAPDEGAGFRNYIDLSAANNDMIVRHTAKASTLTTGPRIYPTNIILGEQALAIGAAAWLQNADTTNPLAQAQPAVANKNRLGVFGFEGRQIVTVSNDVPFCEITRAVNTMTVDTQIDFDASNILAFRFSGNTDSISYVLSGLIFGTAVLWADHDPGGVVLTVTNNSGLVRLTFTSLTAAVPVINVAGVVRHV